MGQEFVLPFLPWELIPFPLMVRSPHGRLGMNQAVSALPQTGTSLWTIFPIALELVLITFIFKDGQHHRYQFFLPAPKDRQDF